MLQKIRDLKPLRKKQVLQSFAVMSLLIAAFFAGRFTAAVAQKALPAATQKALQSAEKRVTAEEKVHTVGEEKLPVSRVLISGASEGNWGLSFQQEGKPPVANATHEELAQYDAWYAQDTQEKVIYLTFDCGYENGNTPAILAALEKHHAPATFFAVGNFIADNPELIRQMLAQGHTVGNHTMHHPDMSKISEIAAFEKEIKDLEQIFQETTGQEIARYYRPPQGKYSEANLKMAQQLGYRTFFWSLAYVDWYEDQQPTKEEAFEKLLGRIHPGAVVLLHNTSATNAAILDELLTKWEEMGYRFAALKDLTEAG